MSLMLFLPAIALLVALSGFFSGSETALTAVSRARMYQLEREGSRRAREVNRLVADRERVIGAILLGNTFLNILISSLTTEVLTARFGDRAVAITTVLITLVLLVFAEVLPKTLAIARRHWCGGFWGRSASNARKTNRSSSRTRKSAAPWTSIIARAQSSANTGTC
jgi:Mg2+/Co2+ transporter CorB